jgi:hypothetical protein
MDIDDSAHEYKSRHTADRYQKESPPLGVRSAAEPSGSSNLPVPTIEIDNPDRLAGRHGGIFMVN